MGKGGWVEGGRWLVIEFLKDLGIYEKMWELVYFFVFVIWVLYVCFFLGVGCKNGFCLVEIGWDIGFLCLFFRFRLF